ncbi:GNAT family N-acetyltransferase [Devosia aquimaris]|uniref:GNAT family N-acetyltransferase n=1 Tax=Devosia aquimaris TaxID=2866214 RepID=UPI001CD0BC19|nr:GNAT family N-acetyltransferase [Devosia sp. CJK-A8-3]
MTSLSAAPRANERRRPPSPAVQSGARSHVLRTELLTSRAAVDAIAVQWEGLEAQSDGAVLFQGCGWARAVFDFEAARGNADFAPVIAALLDGQRLVAILPMERIRTRARTMLVPLGHAFSQYSDALLAPGTDAAEAIAMLLKAAIEAVPCDAVSFLKVRSDSVLARGMPANHIVTGTEQGAPYVALDAFPDFEAYFATIKPKTRKNMRNARNRLERDGAVTHHVASSTAEQLGVITRTLTGRAERLKDQGLTSRAFRDTAFTDFCKSLAGRADTPLLAMSLHHKDVAIAEQWGFIHNQRYYAFVASRDFSNSDESPGKMHLGEVIRTCADHGLRGADLMVPAMPYKLTWATEVVTVSDFAVPVTLRGRVVLGLWDQIARPWLKQAVLNMPSGLRTTLMKLAGRSL